MAYIKNITGIQQLDFQINRVLGYEKMQKILKKYLKEQEKLRISNHGLKYGLQLETNTKIHARIYGQLMLTEWLNFFLKKVIP